MIDKEKYNFMKSPLSSGILCLEQLNRASGVPFSMKQFALKLVGRSEWHSPRCQLTWKLMDIDSRFYVQLQASRTIISGLSRSLLPTPSVCDVVMGSLRKLTMRDGKIINLSAKGKTYGVSIRQLAEQGFLPTPIVSDATVGAVIGKNDEFIITKGLPRKINKNGKDGGVGLARLITMRTCSAAQGRNSGFQNTNKLNPAFVLEMMGFPVTWTLNPFLTTDRSKNQIL